MYCCINFIKEGSMSQSSCRSILDLAASTSISSSRRIFLAKDCPEWSLGCWQLTLPHPLTGLHLISGSVRPRMHPNLIILSYTFHHQYWWFLSLKLIWKSVVYEPAMYVLAQWNACILAIYKKAVISTHDLLSRIVCHKL